LTGNVDGKSIFANHIFGEGIVLEGEFVLSEWAAAGLNVATAVKRGVYTVHESLVVKVIGQLVNADVEQLEQSLRGWLGL
jgi:mRNA interferase MazF